MAKVTTLHWYISESSGTKVGLEVLAKHSPMNLSDLSLKMNGEARMWA